MRKIGLTGGIGSGKSTVAKMLASAGAGLIDADSISRAITQSNGAAMPAIQAAFGDALIAADGSMSRDAMRRLMLSDNSAKARLEAILHPLIGQHIDEQLIVAGAVGHSVAVMDIPLLVENGQRWRHRLDAVWVVDCTVKTQMVRVQARSGWPAEQIEAVLAAQASRAQRLAAADAVIYNDAVIMSQLEQQVLDLLSVTKAARS